MGSNRDSPPSDHGQPTSAALFEQIYSQLRCVAQERLHSERPGHTLQATALVHEVWLRLVGDRGMDYGGRAQFFAAAVEAMRRILIDHARKKGAVRRGGGRRPLPLAGGVDLASDDEIADAVSLDDLILRLEKEDPRAALVVRLRYFAGLSIAETAGVLGVSPATVKNEWAYARAWLAEAWKESDDDQPCRPADR
jgi:RNA polymerase sigma factor (TIGR02999 family)